MYPTREGHFKAKILEHWVTKPGRRTLPTFVCRFQLFEESINGQSVPLDHDYEIIGYFNLRKRNGKLNWGMIHHLKVALGWNALDVSWLQRADFRRMVVRVELAFVNYNNQTRLQIQRIRPENANRTEAPRANGRAHRMTNKRSGSKRRANAGRTTKPNRGRRSGRHRTRRPKPNGAAEAPAPPVPPAPAAPGLTKQQAWESFRNDCPENFSEEQIEREWFRILGEMFPGTPLEQLSPQEWERFAAEATVRIIPTLTGEGDSYA